MDQDQTEHLQEHVRAAAAAASPLNLRGAGSKAFLGRAATGEPLDIAGHHGIVNYQPKELVVTARAGTTLDAIDAALAEHGQGLPFEPPGWAPGPPWAGPSPAVCPARRAPMPGRRGTLSSAPGS